MRCAPGHIAFVPWRGFDAKAGVRPAMTYFFNPAQNRFRRSRPFAMISSDVA